MSTFYIASVIFAFITFQPWLVYLGQVLCQMPVFLHFFSERKSPGFFGPLVVLVSVVLLAIATFGFSEKLIEMEVVPIGKNDKEILDLLLSLMAITLGQWPSIRYIAQTKKKIWYAIPIFGVLMIPTFLIAVWIPFLFVLFILFYAVILASPIYALVLMQKNRWQAESEN